MMKRGDRVKVTARAAAAFNNNKRPGKLDWTDRRGVVERITFCTEVLRRANRSRTEVGSGCAAASALSLKKARRRDQNRPPGGAYS
jgi:hypothetical protein